MNSSSRHYLSYWPRNTTTAHLQATILMYCTKGQPRRLSRVTVATQAPVGITLVTPEVTLLPHLRVKKENITIEGCKSSIFVDDARNVCKETFSCSVLMWALERFSCIPVGVLTLQINMGLHRTPPEISPEDGPVITPIRQTLGYQVSVFLA